MRRIPSMISVKSFFKNISIGVLILSVLLWMPLPAHAVTCKFGSDIGGGVCRGYLTAVGAHTWTSPSDWNNSNNTIEAIGGGGSGSATLNTGDTLSGGGGGEYRKISNFSIATPGTTAFNYTIGSGGTAVSLTTGRSNGRAGTATSFNTSSLIANPGGAGVAGVGNYTVAGGAGGTGGTGAAGSANGGAGGTSPTNHQATGAGGAGGPDGAGLTPPYVVTGNPTNGAAGDAGKDGSGGTSACSMCPYTGVGAATAGNGGNGSIFRSPYGSGGGGGGVEGFPATGGSGGLYGGGGGAAYGVSTSATSGAGAQGIIVITYTPASNCPTSASLSTGGFGFLLPAGIANRLINKNGINTCVTNGSGNNYFIPGNTAAEIQSFLNAASRLGVSVFAP